jgi:7-keto-8-aminopelargonate synthetase-like enzyme
MREPDLVARLRERIANSARRAAAWACVSRIDTAIQPLRSRRRRERVDASQRLLAQGLLVPAIGLPPFPKAPRACASRFAPRIRARTVERLASALAETLAP